VGFLSEPDKAKLMRAHPDITDGGDARDSLQRPSMFALSVNRLHDAMHLEADVAFR
jgi:hypothetical protein